MKEAILLLAVKQDVSVIEVQDDLPRSLGITFKEEVNQQTHQFVIATNDLVITLLRARLLFGELQAIESLT